MGQRPGEGQVSAHTSQFDSTQEDRDFETGVAKSVRRPNSTGFYPEDSGGKLGSYAVEGLCEYPYRPCRQQRGRGKRGRVGQITRDFS